MNKRLVGGKENVYEEQKVREVGLFMKNLVCCGRRLSSDERRWLYGEKRKELGNLVTDVFCLEVDRKGSDDKAMTRRLIGQKPPSSLLLCPYQAGQKESLSQRVHAMES